MKEILKHLYTIAFIAVAYFLNRLYAYFHFLFTNKPLSIEFINLNKLDNKKKLLCLFVVYSSKLEKNHLRALNGLYDAGYEVIVIANKNMTITSAEQKKLFGLFYNHNVGRDIDAYCRAMTYIYQKKLLDSFPKVLFLNDSVIFLNNCGKYFTKFSNSTNDYVGIASMSVHNFHIPSWCFQLSSTCLLQPAIVKFFTTFMPMNSRRYLIIHGEIALTQTLLQAGYAPQTLDDPSSLPNYTKLNSYFFPTIVFHHLANSLFKIGISIDPVTHDFVNSSDIDPSKFVTQPCDPERFSDLLFSLGKFDYIVNRVHLFNLNAVLYNEFPFIKKDLYFRCVYSPSVLKAFANELGGKENSDIEAEVTNYILNKPCINEMPLIKRKLLAQGII